MVSPKGAGIQKYQSVMSSWTPAFAGVTTFYGIITVVPTEFSTFSGNSPSLMTDPA
jgi:hypothetical protein